MSMTREQIKQHIDEFLADGGKIIYLKPAPEVRAYNFDRIDPLFVPAPSTIMVNCDEY